MHEWVIFFRYLYDFLCAVYDVTNVPAWNALKSFSCVWIATSILRFHKPDDMEYKFHVSLSATAIFILCIMELSRVMTGVSQGVSPFMAMLLFMFARRLHVAGGNISNFRIA